MGLQPRVFRGSGPWPALHPLARVRFSTSFASAHTPTRGMGCTRVQSQCHTYGAPLSKGVLRAGTLTRGVRCTAARTPGTLEPRRWGRGMRWTPPAQFGTVHAKGPEISSLFTDWGPPCNVFSACVWTKLGYKCNRKEGAPKSAVQKFQIYTPGGARINDYIALLQ